MGSLVDNLTLGFQTAFTLQNLRFLYAGDIPIAGLSQARRERGAVVAG